MSRINQLALVILLVCNVLIMQAGCVFAPPREVPPQTGRVLDADTQQPIKDAIVVVRWSGTAGHTIIPVDSREICYHVESAETDMQGSYSTPPWIEPSKYRDLGLKEISEAVYKPGYRYARVERANSDSLYLKRDSSQAEERVEYLMSLIRATGCHSAGISKRNVYALREKIYYEAKELGAPDRDLQWIRDRAASAWLALDPSVSSLEADKAVSEFLRENLK